MKEYNLTIPLEITFNPKRNENKVHMFFSDTTIDIKDEDNNNIGRVSGCVGGGIELTIEKDDGRIFYINAKVLWNTFVKMLNRNELIIK